MKLKATSIFSMFIFALVLLLSNNPAQAKIEAAPAYGFEVSISPDPQTPDVFQAKLTITDIASATTVAQPTVRFRAGEPAQTGIGENEEGISFQFWVSVSKAGAEANYKAEAIRKGTVLSRSQAKVLLNK